MWQVPFPRRFYSFLPPSSAQNTLYLTLSSNLVLPENPSSFHHGESKQAARKACIPRTKHDWTELPVHRTGSKPRLFFRQYHRDPAKPDHGRIPTRIWNHCNGEHWWAKRRTENPTGNCWEPSSPYLHLKQHPGATAHQNQALQIPPSWKNLRSSASCVHHRQSAPAGDSTQLSIHEWDGLFSWKRIYWAFIRAFGRQYGFGSPRVLRCWYLSVLFAMWLGSLFLGRTRTRQLILERKDGENAFCLLFSLHSLGYLIWKRSHVRTA